MSVFRNVARRFDFFWAQGGDDDYDDIAEDTEELDDSSTRTARRSRASHSDSPDSASSRYSDSLSGDSILSDSHDSEESVTSTRHQRFTAPASSPASLSGVSSDLSSRKFRPHATPMRSREKNIYTLKPKSMDEASLAADYLKTGCAVVVNLEEVEKMIAIRIIDFMSGVCYGLEYQGHAMKLGETIFLFTPGDFEISSDETDYGENRDFIFKEVSHDAKTAPRKEGVAVAPEPRCAPAAAERRSWER